MQTALYGKIKEGRETGHEWLIGVNTKDTLPFNCSNTTHKTRQRHVTRLFMSTKARKARINHE